jgi:hypothetical protein
MKMSKFNQLPKKEDHVMNVEDMTVITPKKHYTFFKSSNIHSAQLRKRFPTISEVHDSDTFNDDPKFDS